MRSLTRAITLLMFLVIGVTFAYADVISYTFTGANGSAGTDWTLVDPNGFIPDNTNVVNLVTSSTDFFSMGVDYGPIIGIGDAGEQSGNSVCINAATPCFEINIGIVNPFGSGTYLVPYLFAGEDGSTGTFNSIQDGSTLTITDVSVPEPGSASLLLAAVGLLGLISITRKQNA